MAGLPTSQTQGDTGTNPNDKLPAFTVYTMVSIYTLPTHWHALRRLRFDLNLQNLTNERYRQYYYSRIAPVAGVYGAAPCQDGQPGEPFSATFSVAARF